MTGRNKYPAGQKEWGKGNKYEYFLYLALFGVALLFPFLRVGEMALDEEMFKWRYVFEAWIDLLPFVVLLVVHTLFLLPILLYKRRSWRYATLTTALVCCFAVFTYFRFQFKFERMSELAASGRTEQIRPMPSKIPGMPVPPAPGVALPDSQDTGAKYPAPDMVWPPAPKGIPGPVIFNTLFAIMLLGCNLAIRLMFKHYWDMRKMEHLEKTQISPHFFMNSLNNIHGMVEIDPVKAQDMILELSGMMKYVLYESSSRKIPLSREIGFIANYVALMRVRFTPNKVSIRLCMPSKEEVEHILVPPLMFINFIENAFKHGVDYSASSTVEIMLKVENEGIVFCCSNTVHKNIGEKENFGIGLANVRKRLDILYPGRYLLDMDDDGQMFNITLKIPA